MQVTLMDAEMLFSIVSLFYLLDSQYFSPKCIVLNQMVFPHQVYFWKCGRGILETASGI